MLYREIDARCCKNSIKHRNVSCGHNAEFCNVNKLWMHSFLLSRKALPASTAVMRVSEVQRKQMTIADGLPIRYVSYDGPTRSLY
jgi:hypothetical protein